MFEKLRTGEKIHSAPRQMVAIVEDKEYLLHLNVFFVTTINR